MKQLIRIITLVLLFQSSFAKLNDVLMVQLQRHYRTADYKIGLQKTREEIRSAERKKDSVREVRLAVLYSYQALYQKSLSKEKEYITSLTKASENLVASAPGLYFSAAYSSLIEALLLDARVSEAAALSNSIREKLDACLALNGVARDQVLLSQWKIQYANGNYKTLLSELTSKSYLLLNTVTARDSVQVRSKVKVIKLPVTEVRSRKGRYSECIQLLAKTYLSNGYADSALAVLLRHELWLKKELKFQEGAMANSLFLIAQSYDMLDQRSKTLDYVRKASGASLKFFAQHAPIRIEIQELHINTLIASERYEEANIYNNDLDVKVLGYYGKSGFGYHRNKYIDIEHLLLNHSWKKAERDLTDYSAVKSFYPASHPFRLESGKDLFRMYVRNNKLEEAEKVLDTLLELARSKYGEQSPNYHLFLLEKATYHSVYTDKFQESEKEFTSGLTALRKDFAPTHPDFLFFRHREAELLLEVEKYDTAQKRWDEVLADLTRYPGEQSLPYAVALSHVVTYDVIAGKYTLADLRIKKAVSILEKTESEKYKADLILCLETASRLSIIQGDFMGANKLILQAAKILKKSDGETSTAAFEELTRLNIYFGKYQRTEEDLYEVIALREKRFGKSHRSLRSPLNQLAYLKIVTGAFTEAEEMLQRAAGIAKQVYGDQSIKLTETLLLQRQLYTVAGDYEKAQSAIENAVELTIKKFGKDHVRVGILLHELALARFLSTGSLEAKNVLVTAPEEGGADKTRGIKDNDKKKKKKVSDDKKTTRRNSDLPAEPEPLLSLSINTIKNGLGDNTPALAEALENAAIYHLSKGNYDRALENSRRAMEIWNAQLTAKNLRSAKLLTLQGSVLQAQGNYAPSLENYTKAMELFKSIFDDNHPDYVATLGKCAQLHYINNNTKEAIQYSTETIDKSLVYIDKIFPGLSERGKAAYWEKAKQDFDFFKTLAIVNADKNPALLGKLMDMQIKTKAILLNSSIKVKKRIMSSGDSVLIGNYQRWQSLRENLATALSMSAEQRKESGIEAGKIQEEIEQLERKLSAGSEVFAKNYDQSAYGWETLKKTLAPGELFIEVVPFRYFNKKFTDTTWYAFLFVSNNTKGNPEYAVIKDGHLLAGRYLRYYRNCVRFETADEYSYTKFWEPIQPHIPATTKTILFDADGAYNQLNVEAFKTPEGKYLLDKYNIVLVGTARDVLEASSKEKAIKGRTSSGFVFIGNPIYYQTDFALEKSVPQLDGAEQEVKAINQQVASLNKTTSIMLNQEATESKVKELQYPEVFHIATHGFFLTDVSDESNDEFSEKAVQNPLLRSGLLLQKGGQILQVENLYAINREEGVLTAYEAMNLNFDNTKLVVLSACETGLGEVKIGEGVYGLQRSFLVAGAQSIVMSLFKVNDEVTKQLMLEFYKRWQSGESKREAFANAKREVMKTYPAPKYWASFIMIGVN